MTPLLLIGLTWLLVLAAALWLALTRSPVTFDPQLPPTWRPHPRTIVRTHHLTGGRSG
jgi:hypothetical protein